MRTFLLTVSVAAVCLCAAQAHACAPMQRLAQEHARSMAERNSMDHAGFEDRARRGAKAENVAVARTQAEAMAMWVASPPHASNMALPGCKGVASAVSRSGARYWAMEIAKTGRVR